MGGFSTPSGGGGGFAISATVVTEQAFGQGATAGIATTASAGDHTHGTPAAPATAVVKVPISTGVINALVPATAIGMVPLGYTATAAYTEPFIQTRVPAGQFARLWVLIWANTLNDVSIITLRKNGSDTALTVTIPAGSTTTIMDDTHTVTVAQGDLVNYKIDNTAAGVGTITLQILSMEFSST